MSALKRIAGAVLAAPLLLLAPVAIADSYPARPIRLVVPFAAGTSIDTATRVLARGMAKELGTSVVVENKGGGGGAIGAIAVANSAPDGYTILLGTAAQLIGKIAQPSAAFDPLKDFIPVSLAYRGASTLTVSTNSPVKSASELVRWAKAHPGTLNYYSGGVGTAAHLLGATFAIRENIQAVHIPVHSVTDMLPQLNEQAPHFAFFITPAVRPYIDANKLRALAVTSRERSPQMPDVPTLYEIFKDDDLVQESWIGIWAPAGTPAPIVGRLFRATVQAVNSREFKEAIARQGHVPVASDSPESFAGYVRSEYAKFSRLARTAQLKPE